MIFDKSNPFSSKIISRYPLTKENSTKETYHITLDLKDSNLHFKVGDSLGIFAQNDPLLVAHYLTALRAEGQERILDPRSQKEISLWDFLSFKANLSRVSSSFLKLMHEYETLHDKKQHLSRLLREENRALLMQYLNEHDPLDLLKEYAEANAPLQELCNQFSLLLPRFYSVASSLLASPDRVDLTVAVSTFTHSGEERFGVASHFLCHIAEEEKTPIPIYVQTAHAFALPADPHAAIIMIGPGTGVAPYRAFMQERLHTQAPGKNWLFFGERTRKNDYFYQDFWEELVSQNKLRLDLAFSRDQPHKIYVQDRMQEQAKDLWKWIQEGAYIYVCGDAPHMAKEVQTTLEKIAQEEGGLSAEEARIYFKTMRTQRRYLLDVY